MVDHARVQLGVDLDKVQRLELHVEVKLRQPVVQAPLGTNRRGA